MRRQTALRSEAVFLCALVATGWQNKGGGDTVGSGVIRSLTDRLAAFGEEQKNGYAIGRDEINAKGGLLGKKVELDIYDDQSKPDQAVQGVSKLVDQDHVTIILGSYSSENTKAILPTVTQRQIPLIMPTATADNVMDSRSSCGVPIRADANDHARTTIAF